MTAAAAVRAVQLMRAAAEIPNKLQINLTASGTEIFNSVPEKKNTSKSWLTQKNNLKPHLNKIIRFRSSLFKGLRVEGRALVRIFKGEALKRKRDF